MINLTKTIPTGTRRSWRFTETAPIPQSRFQFQELSSPVAVPTAQRYVVREEVVDQFRCVEQQIARMTLDAQTKDSAIDILEILRKDGLVPGRAVYSSAREVYFYFFGTETMAGGAHRLYAALQCGRGELAISLVNRETAAAQDWDVEEDDLVTDLDRIRSFLKV